MKEAPLDIMLEIFTHLHPKDLLNLARTSKDLRSVLLSKTSAQVWRAVLRNARLPPLPKDLSEPEYASLAFDTWCNVCGGGNCETISWQCRIRCHKTCAAKRLYPFDKLKKLPTWSEGIEEMVDLGFFAIIPRVMISVHEKDIFRGRHFGPLGWIWISYYTPYIIEQFRLEFLEVKDDAERLAQWKGKKAEEYVELSSYEIVWRKWSQRRLSVGQRKTVTGDLREERINEILKKLVALGWNEHNLERTFQLIQHPLVNQSKRLTDEGAVARSNLDSAVSLISL
ncbi:hypothetical protein VNI00_007642 [Paramarasmius palmivorus]|uniref:F-box domain-containing protein n=1 Tax=Paramarasmius palmivorus TaxID=297713 RepID=A0AAW0D4K4_9AGAR